MKSTGNYIDPLSPIYDLPYDPKGGSGILEAEIFIEFLGQETSVKRLLAYSWVETVNGIEVDIEKPWMPNASNIENDIYYSMQEVMKFDHLNFIQQK